MKYCEQVHAGDWTSHRERAVLESVGQLPDILMREEVEACGGEDGGGGLLSTLHNRGCLVAQLAQQTSRVSLPILEALQARKKFLLSRNKELKEEEKILSSKISK